YRRRSCPRCRTPPTRCTATGERRPTCSSTCCARTGSRSPPRLHPKNRHRDRLDAVRLRCSMTAVPQLPLTISEAEFQTVVTDYAQLMGWVYCHYFPLQNRRGRYQTPV